MKGSLRETDRQRAKCDENLNFTKMEKMYKLQETTERGGEKEELIGKGQTVNRESVSRRDGEESKVGGKDIGGMEE